MRRNDFRGVRAAALVLGSAACALAWLTLPIPPWPPAVAPTVELLRRGPQEALLSLAGRAPRPHDIVIDLLGAKLLLRGRDPYPVLGPALEEHLGASWALTHRSKHPPTAFLLAAPLAELPWRLASALWAAAMLVTLAVSLRLAGFAWPTVAGLLPLLLLWPPVAWSLMQLTPIWLLGVVLAWRWRDRPWAAGAALGLAAWTKLFPAVALAPFLQRRRWPSLLGFAAVWAVGLALVALLSPLALPGYVDANRTDALPAIDRRDNGALLPFAWHAAGWPAALPAAAGLAALAAPALRAPALTPTAWALWVWLGIALLPVAWVYSLLPLLPWLLRVLAGGHPLARVFAGLTVLVGSASFYPSARPGGVAGAILCSGAAFAVGAIPETFGIRLPALLPRLTPRWLGRGAIPAGTRWPGRVLVAAGATTLLSAALVDFAGLGTQPGLGPLQALGIGLGALALWIGWRRLRRAPPAPQ